MKIKPWKKIMIAVRDFDRASQALLYKAAALALRFGATLEVLHVSAIDDEPFAIRGLLVKPASPREIQVVQRQRLEKLVKPLIASGLQVKCISVLDYPPADGIVRQVLKQKPDVLIVQSHRHTRLARAFLSNTDWELIRNCPCPLWVAKSNKLTPHLAVLAAVDPFHSHAKPADLDNEILGIAGQIVGSGAGRLGICHAYTLPQNAISGMGEIALVPTTAAQVRHYKARMTDAIKSVGTQYAIASKNQLLIEGDPAVGIPLLSKRWKADLIVMGAVSRRGLKRIFIGNTAERALDATACDVLVVKPRSFKCPVPAKSAG